MERMTKGLEAHSHAELLPDRVEMRRSKRITKRIRKGNVRCDATNVAGNNVTATNNFTCSRINA
jgi:hypothetical protein